MRRIYRPDGRFHNGRGDFEVLWESDRNSRGSGVVGGDVRRHCVAFR
jgi:hypothetical protein